MIPELHLYHADNPDENSASDQSIFRRIRAEESRQFEATNNLLHAGDSSPVSGETRVLLDRFDRAYRLPPLSPKELQAFDKEAKECREYYLLYDDLMAALRSLRVDFAKLKTRQEQREAEIAFARADDAPQPIIDEAIARLRVKYADNPDDLQAAIRDWQQKGRTLKQFYQLHPPRPASPAAARYLSEI